MQVALRKESVDRNCTRLVTGCEHIRSLSARRAWIEILPSKQCAEIAKVALRKESVDRNPYIPLAKVRHCVALRKESVDRNIFFTEVRKMDANVALRKESVDRNIGAS